MHVSTSLFMFGSVGLLWVILMSLFFVSCVFWAVIFSVKKLFSFFQDDDSPTSTRYASGLLGVVLVCISVVLVHFALHSITSRVWVMIIDPVTGLVVGSIAAVAYTAKKINRWRGRKKRAEDIKFISDLCRGDFDWESVPDDTKVEMARLRRLYDKVMEKYCGSEGTVPPLPSFVPQALIELFEDGNKPASFVPYIPRYLVARAQFEQLCKDKDKTLVVAGYGVRGVAYRIVQGVSELDYKKVFRDKEYFYTSKQIELEQEILKKTISMIDEYIHACAHFLECSVVEFGAKGSQLYREKIDVQAKKRQMHAEAIDEFIKEIGKVDSSDEQRQKIINAISSLLNKSLVRSGENVEIIIVSNNAKLPQGKTQLDVDAKLAEYEKKRKELEAWHGELVMQAVAVGQRNAQLAQREQILQEYLDRADSSAQQMSFAAPLPQLALLPNSSSPPGDATFHVIEQQKTEVTNGESKQVTSFEKKDVGEDLIPPPFSKVS
jgi:hypothetical protein